MCGRYSRNFGREIMKKNLEILGGKCLITSPMDINYNCRPEEIHPVITNKGNILEVIDLEWGVTTRHGSMCINARAERVEESPTWQPMFESRRVIIPASGIFEWKKQNFKPSQPYHFERKDGGILFMAGVATEDRFVILTVEADQKVGLVHLRMPLLLLDEQMLHRWMSSETPNISAFTTDDIRYYHRQTEQIWRYHPVARAIGGSRESKPEYIKPIRF